MEIGESPVTALSPGKRANGVTQGNVSLTDRLPVADQQLHIQLTRCILLVTSWMR
jgi:hypothetical protein